MQIMNHKIPAVLSDGYQRFRQSRYPEISKKYNELADSQSPHTMVISCADSRVDPTTFFDCGPGELFVVRNVANIVPPARAKDGGLNQHGTLAALEYAVNVLAVQNIVVIGHSGCGGVGACLKAADTELPFDYVAPWLDNLVVARTRVLNTHAKASSSEKQRALEHEGVRMSLENLAGFPFVAEAISTQNLALHGAWFDIGSGALHWLTTDGELNALATV